MTTMGVKRASARGGNGDGRGACAKLIIYIYVFMYSYIFITHFPPSISNTFAIFSYANDGGERTSMWWRYTTTCLGQTPSKMFDHPVVRLTAVFGSFLTMFVILHLWISLNRMIRDYLFCPRRKVVDYNSIRVGVVVIVAIVVVNTFFSTG